ncbi:hypothetical protein D915_003574 [Fasciola hepatica]|uniref:Uncharacterized protein n=1 Tax=Fasciola hepatica TaxID=6192 RepID=A0A2H1CHU6_FASHE|nr:hypothetical protein D915_003574 [Fasciola hepatica]
MAFFRWLNWALLINLILAKKTSDFLLKELDFDYSSTGEDLEFSNEPSLLRGSLHAADLQCLRLYSQKRFAGAWSDMCDSNELLSHFNIFHTKSVCAPKDNFWQKKRYWLLFEEPSFRGKYIMLPEQECVRNLPRSGLTTVGSVLVCNVDALVASKKVRCIFPAKPWRTYQAVSDYEAREAVQKAIKMQSRVASVAYQTEDEQSPEKKFTGNALDRMKNGAIAITSDDN